MYGSGPDFGKPLPSYTGQVDENGVYNGTLDNPPRFFEGINPNDKYFFKDNECYTNANPNKDGTWGPCTPCEGNIGGTNGVEKGGSPKTDGVKK
jgi:hypothetical protein